ncbi:hypothetical protein F511_14745 [Dorcoceras hygrometricum]|uniref:Uncharacterized protein n=1 Tax=Dorcoceras hygrometricum TaxID=472368 RepID=A0A2Z7B037_9LAMI|nr:hypothetical protein F511_14745 [Dorcoceras hygrometricum]
MAAYASLLSLGHILHQFLQHPPRQRDVFDRAQIESLLDNITFLQDFLEDYSLIRGDEIQGLEGKIAGSAYAAEDIIESRVVILSVVGMGGIGKTTLARHIFSNPLIVSHFDLHAWVTISQQYSVHEILLGLIKDTGVVAGEGEKLTDDELGLRLHKILFGRRYLIVMDDMWSIEVWHAIKRFFPDNDIGCRILVTTRLSNVADDFHSCTPHRLPLLDEVQSWSLFCNKVFGKSEICPLALVEIGKTIVRNCRGLPLATATISGLLAKSSRTVEYWESVANGTYEALNMGGDGFCFEILSLSYRHLPVHLKPCFLYMAIYPEDSKIKISRLVQLWVAEGIVKPIRDRSLEEVAMDNLKDLIDRNLIQVRDYGSRNNIKSCTIHDLLRELCLKEARKEKFLCVAMIHSLNRHPRSISDMRRLIIQRTSDEEEFQQEVFDAMNLPSCTRSLIIRDAEFRPIKLPVRSRLLRVLSIGNIYSHSVEDIWQLVNLRCIHFENLLFPNQLNILKSLSLPWNLQTVNFGGTFSLRPISLPTEIWEMPHLRHLKTAHCFFYLPDPPSTNSKNGRRDIFELKNLQTLYQIWDFRCTDEVLRRIPNLKKLGITYRGLSGGFGWDYYEVYNLAHLCNLELFILTSWEKLPQNFGFPRSLKKLTLNYCKVSWGYLTVVGSLPHLEALHLLEKAVIGREWNPVEGQFLKLKYLRIVDTDLEEWVADTSHFPNLEKLKLYWLRRLKEIPYGVGENGTLRSISPNLKKLGITYRLIPDGIEWDYYELYNLVHLRNLESFTLESPWDELPQNLCFPCSLKKLTLKQCILSWEYLTVVGSLPHLEALNLMSYAVRGREWNPVEGQFLKLKSLRIDNTYLEEWVADSSHFPNLENLQLKRLRDLKEIPYGVGEIGTLRSISLFWCSSSANASAEKIQEEQQQLGNSDLQVRIQALP